MSNSPHRSVSILDKLKLVEQVSAIASVSPPQTQDLLLSIVSKFVWLTGRRGFVYLNR
ncbi:hypothetical protein HC931_05645 [Candidatus Gracilibacteria bacterium]|nr:hypothetical protein [Candidatus Gracilibacteria bacterium]